jgi:hypothetical protein
MAKQQGPVVETLDIETAPIRAMVWAAGGKPQFVGLENIEQDWTLLSFCSKKLGVKRPVYHDTYENEDGNLLDDTLVLKKLWVILDNADFVIAQNGKNFDLKKITARMIEIGLPPFRPVKVIDTLLASRAIASFTSHKLAWVTRNYEEGKLAHGQFPGIELWREYLAGNGKARNEMKKYNIRDVTSTEEYYLQLRPWMIQHPNFAAYIDDDLLRCHRCVSTDLELQAAPYKTDAGQYDQYRCGGCGGFSRSRYTKNSLAKRKATLIG